MVLKDTADVSAVNCALCQNLTSNLGENNLKLAVTGDGLAGSVAAVVDGAAAGAGGAAGAGAGAGAAGAGTTAGLPVAGAIGGDGFNCSLPGLMDAAILSSKLTGFNKDGG